MNSSQICIREVNDNLRRIKLDMPLTRPLLDLNENCEFREKYQEWCNIQDGLPEGIDVKKLQYAKAKSEHEKLPEIRKRRLEYQRKHNKKPEVIKKNKEYRKEYYKRPEVIISQKEYRKKYYQAHKDDPGEKEKRRERDKIKYQKQKALKLEQLKGGKNL